MVTGKIKPTRASSGLHTLKHSATNSADVFIIQDTKRIAILYGIVLYCYSGALNTLELVVLHPTKSGIFYCLFLTIRVIRTVPFFGWGAVVRKAIGIANSMFRTPRPPYAHLNAIGGSYPQLGDMNHD